jgi:predicted dehydrogenase
MAFVATGMEEPFRAYGEVVGTTGRIEIPNLFEGTEIRIYERGNERVKNFPALNRFQLQMEHFSDCILKDTQPMLPPEDGLRNTAVLVALKKAAKVGETIAVES